jgi:hypothetical protein
MLNLEWQVKNFTVALADELVRNKAQSIDLCQALSKG